MAESNENIKYTFKVDSSEAVDKLNGVADGLANVESKAARVPKSMQRFNQIMAQAEGPLANVSKALYSFANNTTLPIGSIDQLRNAISRSLDPINEFTEALDRFKKLSKGAQINIDSLFSKGSAPDLSTIKDALSYYEDLDKFRATQNKNNAGPEGQINIDRATKSAKEAASVYKELIKHQNDFNAGLKGMVNVDAPSEAARRSIAAWKSFFDTSTAGWDRFRKHQERALDATQNKNNAGPKGQINVDPATKDAAASAKVLSDAYKTLDRGFSGSLRGVKKLSSAFNSDLNPAIKTSTVRIAKIGIVLDKALAHFHNFENTLRNLNNTLNKTSKRMSRLGGIIKTAIGIGIGKAISESSRSMIDMIETTNLFNAALGDESREAGYKFINTMAEIYSLDPKNLMDHAATFYNLGYAMGLPADSARKLSKSLTILGTNLASLHNMPVDQTMERLTSAMRGQQKAASSLYTDIRATTLEEYAAARGMNVQVETMNEASREILRFLVMVEQTKVATNDWAETLNYPANQLRIFKEQIVILGRSIGQFFYEPLKRVLPIINGVIMALRVMIDMIATLMGVTRKIDKDIGSLNTGLATGGGISFDKPTNSLDKLGGSADKAKKKVKSLLAPFDELNILSADSASDKVDSIGSGGGATGGMSFGEVDPKLLQWLDETQLALVKLPNAATKARDSILAFFGITPSGDSWVYAPEVFQENLEELFNHNYDQSIEALFNFDYGAFLGNVSDMFDEFKRIGKDAIRIVLLDLTNLLGIDTSDSSIAEWITNLNDKFAEFNRWLHENEGTLALVLARVTEVGLAFMVFRAVVGVLTPIVSVLSTAFSVLGTTLNIIFDILSVITTPLGALGTIISTSLVTPITNLGTALSSCTGPLTPLLHGLGTLVTLFAGPLAKALTFFLGLGATLFIGAFVEWALSSDEFKGHLQLWGKELTHIFEGVGSIFTSLGTIFGNVIDDMIEHFGVFFDNISTVVDDILLVFSGIIDFIDGVFSGDWEAAWKGVKEIFGGVVLGITNSLNAIFSAVLGIVDSFVSWFVTAVLKGLRALVGLIPGVGDSLAEKIPESYTSHLADGFKPEKFTEFAVGGVVTGPTRALIGEAGRSEAVIPLDNSPQMLQLVEQIADRVTDKGNETIVRVYIGDREWDAFTYQSAQRGKNLVGAQPIMEGRV